MHRLPLALAALVLSAACAGQRPAAPTPAPAPAAAAPSAPIASRDPVGVRYAPWSSRYRIEQSTHIAQEVMGQLNEADLSARQLISTVATAAGGNLAVAVTIDSIEVSGPPGADAGLAAARGQTFRLAMTPFGEVTSSAASDTTNAALQQVATGLRDFVPRLPSLPIAAGLTWTDTVTVSRTGEAPIATRSIRQHRVVGWEDRDGARALHLTMTSTYTVTGSTEAQGQAVELSGGGQTFRDAYVSATGLLLGSVDRDSALITANVVALGMTVPIRRTSRSTVTRLP
ncbi:MAG: hypothetical protein AAB409_00245 [Gemmatimonadota bacterium]